MILWLIVIGSAIWVAADASSIGARKGLIPGFFNMGPAGWFFATLLLWIIGFPGYLATRGRIKEAVALERSGGQVGHSAAAQQWQAYQTPQGVRPSSGLDALQSSALPAPPSQSWTPLENNLPQPPTPPPAPPVPAPAPTTPPAGWYVDPADAQLLLWWDGTAWTDHRTPRSQG